MPFINKSIICYKSQESRLFQNPRAISLKKKSVKFKDETDEFETRRQRRVVTKEVLEKPDDLSLDDEFDLPQVGMSDAQTIRDDIIYEIDEELDV